MDNSIGSGIGEIFRFLVGAVFVLTATALAMAIILAMSWLFSRDYQSEAIERGFAQYCTDTGEWAWVGECQND